MAKEDTWESKKNLKNAMDLVNEFKREHEREEEEEVRWQENKEDKEIFSRKLLWRYMAKLMYGWENKRYEREYWKWIKENWRQWKRNLFSRYRRNLLLKKVEEERRGYKEGVIKEEEDKKDQQRIEKDRKYLKGLKDEENNMGNLKDPYDEL